MTQLSEPNAIPKPDDRLIQPFIKSAQNVMQTMANYRTIVGTPFFRDESSQTRDVSGIIAFSGAIEGSVIVSFEQLPAQKIVSSFAGTELQFGSLDFNDGIGELANMIAGSAKNELGPGSEISVPTVILGKNHRTARLRNVPCVIIPCSTEAGDFRVEVNLRRAA